MNDDLLAEIVQLLKENSTLRKENLELLREIRDNTKPCQVIIEPFMATSKEQGDIILCNCAHYNLDKQCVAAEWTCPTHGYQTC